MGQEKLQKQQYLHWKIVLYWGTLCQLRADKQDDNLDFEKATVTFKGGNLKLSEILNDSFDVIAEFAADNVYKICQREAMKYKE